MFEYLMYMFKNLTCIFEYLEISKVTIFPGGSQKSDWTQTFDPYCIIIINRRREHVGQAQAANQAWEQGYIRYESICEINIDSQIFEISDILL